MLINLCIQKIELKLTKMKFIESDVMNQKWKFQNLKWLDKKIIDFENYLIQLMNNCQWYYINQLIQAK